MHFYALILVLTALATPILSLVSAEAQEKSIVVASPASSRACALFADSMTT